MLDNIVQAMFQAKQVKESLEHIADVLDLPVPEITDSPDGNGIAVIFGNTATVLVPPDTADIAAHTLNKLIFHNPLKWELRMETCKCAHDKVRENTLIVMTVLKEKGIPANAVIIVGTRAIAKINGAEIKIDLTDDSIHTKINELIT